MKKLLCIALALIMVLSLAACGGAKTEAPAAEAPKTETPAAETPKTDAPKADEPKADAPAEPAELKYDGPAQKFSVNFTSS